MAEKKRGRPSEEFEKKATEAAAAQADEWALPEQPWAPLRCDFLGPAAAGADTATVGNGSADERPTIGWQEKVRFRWTISVPGAPPAVSLEENVVAPANYVFMPDRGIPVPAAWNPALKFGAQVRRALAKAHEECPDHTCNLVGIHKGSPAALPAGSERTRLSGPRAGERWEVSHLDGGSAEVWVAAHHAGNVWWCVQAPSGGLFKARRLVAHLICS